MESYTQRMPVKDDGVRISEVLYCPKKMHRTGTNTKESQGQPVT